MLRYDTGFHEVGDGIWLARYEWHDVNVTVIRGGLGLLMIDTHTSTKAGHEVIADLRKAGLGEVIHVVNTHEHFDHTFGNAAMRATWPGVPIHATRTAAENTLASGEQFKERFRRGGVVDIEGGDPRIAEVLATDLVAADHPFDGRTTIDLGDRLVELVHPGRGHTAGDLVTWVPDANLLQAGDLLEQTAPPVYPSDSWPFDWPATVDAILAMIDADTTVVPGHGLPVDKAWVEGQRGDLALVADEFRRLYAEGVPLEDAAAQGRWPWAVDDWRFENAFARAYALLAANG